MTQPIELRHAIDIAKREIDYISNYLVDDEGNRIDAQKLSEELAYQEHYLQQLEDDLNEYLDSREANEAFELAFIEDMQTGIIAQHLRKELTSNDYSNY